MARPTTKHDLIQAANGQFSKLWDIVDSMTEEERIASFDFGEALPGKEAHWGRDKNVRDVFIHLYEWHRLLLEWVQANQRGEQKTFLPAPYTWKTYQQMNIGFWEKHQGTSYRESVDLLVKSHADTMALIETFSNDELFMKSHFSWTGTTSLGGYCVSATSSHYAWAIKKLKQHKKSYEAAHKKQ